MQIEQKPQKPDMKALVSRYGTEIYKKAIKETGNREEAKRIAYYVLMNLKGDCGEKTLDRRAKVLTERYIDIAIITNALFSNRRKKEQKSLKKAFIPKQKAGGGSRLAAAFLVGVSLALAWAVLGLLMGRGVFSAMDLGYGWFNEHIFRFFTL